MSALQKSPTQKASEDFVDAIIGLVTADWYRHQHKDDTEYQAKREFAAQKLHAALAGVTPASGGQNGLLDASINEFIRKARDAFVPHDALTYTMIAINLANLKSR